MGSLLVTLFPPPDGWLPEDSPAIMVDFPRFDQRIARRIEHVKHPQLFRFLVLSHEEDVHEKYETTGCQTCHPYRRVQEVAGQARLFDTAHKFTVSIRA